MNQAASTRLDVADFDFYTNAFARMNEAVPHRQGMDANEFEAARLDPRTLSVSLEGQAEISVPIVTSLGVYDWISGDFFNEEYPDVPAGDLFNLCANEDLLRQIDGAELTAWLRHLARTEHLLVVDYPVFTGKASTRLDGALPAVITELLSEADLTPLEVSTIGVQHYFHTALILRDRSRIRPGMVDLSETYRTGLANGYFDSFNDKGTRVLDVIEGERLAEAWALYEAYIGSLNYVTPIVESLDFDTFEREMKDPKVNKFVSLQNGELMSMMFLSSDLARYGWLSPSYLATHYFQDIERGSLFEFPCLFTKVSARGLTHTAAILRLLVQVLELAGIDAKVMFDCPAQTQHAVNTVISGFINRGETSVVDPVESCQQRYVAFKLQSGQIQGG